MADDAPDSPRQLKRADIGIFRRLLHYVRPYLRRMVLAAVCLIGASVLGLIFPAIVRSLIDSVFVHHDEHTLNLITAALLAVFAVQGVLSSCQVYLVGWIGERIVANLRRDLFQHLQVLDADFYSERRTGELMSRVTNDVTAVQAAVSENLLSLLQQIITVIGSLAIIFYLDWRLSLLLIVVVPFIMLVGGVIGRRIGRVSRRVQEGLGEAGTVLEETLSNVRVVQAFTREEYEAGRFAARIDQVFALSLQRIRLRAGMTGAITFLAFAAITVILWFGGREVLDGRLTPGGLVSFLFYLILIAGPIGTLTGLYAQAREAMGAATRIFEVLDTKPSIMASPHAATLPPLREYLSFEDVRFAYTPGREVLRGISLRIDAGHMLALVGPSGAGKTTVASLIPRFHDPTEGAIRIDGHDVRGVTLASLRGQIALVPQEPALFGVSVRENILYGRLDASADEVEAAARAANAHEFIMELPQRYDTLVGDRGVKLSGGQRQRIALARAILRNPRILILDEATSALDNESERLVQEALVHLMAGRTTLVIAHRLTTIQRADRIMVMDAGEIVESGTHQELLAAEGLYHRLYTMALRSGGERIDDMPGPEAVPHAW